jgi:predicted ABC-type sugar transport system permease subunit
VDDMNMPKGFMWGILTGIISGLLVDFIKDKVLK